MTERVPTERRAEIGAAFVFVATLGPLLTVTSLRRLVVDVRGGSPLSVHAFIALGMCGAAIGAPLLARRADRTGRHLELAALLAAIDAVVTLVTPHLPSLFLLHLFRPIHGAASMGLLALLLGRFRDPRRKLVSRAGGTMIAALALGPCLGAFLGRHAFTAASACAAALSVLLFVKARGAAPRAPTTPRPRVSLASIATRSKSFLGVLFVQRLAIGAFVAVFAAYARTAYGLGDRMVGASFSAFLLTFAITTATIGRRLQARADSRVSGVVLGAVAFAAAFGMLALGPRATLAPALILGGFGAAFVYAPSLAAIAAESDDDASASSLALAQAAGALGMICGPLLAALVDLAIPAAAVTARCATVLLACGALQLTAAVGLAARFAQPTKQRRLERTT